MELAKYIRSTLGVTQASFAKELGVSQGLVWQWLNGRTKITPERAKQIELITQGAVTRHDILPDLFDAPVVKNKPLGKNKQAGKSKTLGTESNLKVVENNSIPRETDSSRILTKGESSMANTNDSLAEVMKMDGAVGTCLVDIASGMVLGKAGGGGVDLDLAGAGNTEVVRSKLKVMSALGLKDHIEDILITLGNQFHLIRLHKNVLFVYVILDKSKANLAMARHKLAEIEKALNV